MRIASQEVTPEVSRFVGTIAGSPSTEVGELVAEQVRSWRFSREIRYLKKAMQQLEDAGLSPKAVPMRSLAPLLEGASFEDDDEMSDRWAALLANAASGERDVPPSFPSVLRELEPEEARILNHAYDALMRIAPELRIQVGIMKVALVPLVGVAETRLAFHIDNLARLRLVRGTSPMGDAGTDDAIRLTDFGEAFVRACRPPSEPDLQVEFTDRAILEEAQRNRQRWIETASGGTNE